MRKYRVLISGEARRMLTEHVFFLASVNPEAAERLRARIMESIRSLETMPDRYPYLDPDDRRSPYRKMAVLKQYLVIYTVQDDTVYVEYVLDDRTVGKANSSTADRMKAYGRFPMLDLTE